MSVKKKILTEIIELLRQNPEQWNFDKHTARHKDRPIEIWMANRFYGTSWVYGSIRSNHHDTNLLWWISPWQWWRVKLVLEVEKAQKKLMDL